MKNPMLSRKEPQYIEICKKHPDNLLWSTPEAKQEGFEHFFEELSTNKKKLFKMLKEKFLSSFEAFKITLKYMPRIRKGQNQSFQDLKEYYKELEINEEIKNNADLKNPINNVLWQELNDFIKSKWANLVIGFTEVPEKLIFQNKAIFFKYALVILQEMEKFPIDQSPQLQSGREVFRIYASLGEIVNEIARWFRNHGIKSQSSHPLGGLVCSPPLAGKAGLGWLGRSGMLITPQFGPRQRIGLVFLQNKQFEFTDNNEHRWIEEYCKKCGLCQKNCPTQAIYSEKVISIENVGGIGSMRTCIDREKCFPYFNTTMGCSICLKVCPFSNGIESFKNLKYLIARK